MRGGCASCLRACLGARLLPQSYQYPNLSEGADRVGGQPRGDKECPYARKQNRKKKKIAAFFFFFFFLKKRLFFSLVRDQ